MIFQILASKVTMQLLKTIEEFIISQWYFMGDPWSL